MLYWDDQTQPPGLVFYLLDNSFADVTIADYPKDAKYRSSNKGAASSSSRPKSPSTGKLLWHAVS